VTKIDAHTHYAGEHPKVIDWLTQNDWKLLTIGGGQERGEVYRRLANEHPDRYAWCTSFPLEEFESPDYAEKIIAGLEKDFAGRAIACKVFKRLGLKLKDSQGNYVQMDHPAFEPIFQWLEDNDHTLTVHVAEPLSCWRPLDENNSYREYYTKHPEYHMGSQPDAPAHGDILASRDRVIERHPKLRVVGAHFGCMEYDVKEVAKRMDAYPNFAVDTSGPARIIDMARQDRQVVREFFDAYADRILYGSDRSARGQLEMDEQELDDSLGRLTAACQVGLDYYCTDKKFQIRGWDVHGLELSEPIQEKIFYSSAKRWYPGI